MRIAIQRARLRHIDRILEIEAASFGRDAWDRPVFLEALDECADLFLIAQVGGAIAGYSITCIGRDAAELISIAVMPEARRHGTGAALMEWTLRVLRRRRIAAWRLMVGINNVTAIRFYRGLGFRRVRTVHDYYGRGRHAWRMELRR